MKKCRSARDSGKQAGTREQFLAILAQEISRACDRWELRRHGRQISKQWGPRSK